MLGDTDSILGSVPQNMSVVQQRDQTAQAQAQKVSDTAMKPGQDAGEMYATGAVAKDLNKVTVTPQMAMGLEKITGQKWDQSVGTKWDANVFTPLVTGMAQAKYHQDMLSGKIDIEKMKEEASAEKEAGKQQSQKELQDIKSQHAKELADLKAAHALELKRTPGAPKDPQPKDPNTQGRELLDAINKANKSDDDATLKSAIDNYNAFAQQHGLSPYKEEPGWLDNALSSVKSLAKKAGGMMGEGADKAKEWLQKNHPELKNPTDADIEWARKKMK